MNLKYSCILGVHNVIGCASLPAFLLLLDSCFPSMWTPYSLEDSCLLLVQWLLEKPPYSLSIHPPQQKERLFIFNRPTKTQLVSTSLCFFWTSPKSQAHTWAHLYSNCIMKNRGGDFQGKIIGDFKGISKTRRCPLHFTQPDLFFFFLDLVFPGNLIAA